MCEWCGDAASRPGPGRPRRYCSDACKVAARVARDRAARGRKACAACFGPVPENHRTYCSTACRKSATAAAVRDRWARNNAARSERARATRGLSSCATCGAEFDGFGTTRRYCSRSCRPSYTAAAKGARRRGAVEVGDRDITWRALGDRDGWSCHLCGDPVDPDARHEWKRPNPMGPSIDHVLPISRGGAHVWENVALAHWVCNVRRRDAVPA